MDSTSAAQASRPPSRLRTSCAPPRKAMPQAARLRAPLRHRNTGAVFAGISCRRAARSATGMLTEPAMWPTANSRGSRTSTSRSPDARGSSARHAGEPGVLTPILRTLSPRLILGRRSVHVEAQAIQPGVQAGARRLVRRTQSSCRKIVRRSGVNPNMLTRWVREAESRRGQVLSGGGTPRDEEVARLKRELSRVTKERDFFREAAAYFAKRH